MEFTRPNPISVECQKRMRSPVASLDLRQMTNESLDAQIERLNQCIERMMSPTAKQKKSPGGIPTKPDFILDISQEISEILLDTPLLDQSLYLLLERSHMVNEDLRSFELNKPPRLDNLTLTPEDIYNIHHSSSKFIKDPTSVSSLTIGNFKIPVSNNKDFACEKPCQEHKETVENSLSSNTNNFDTVLSSSVNTNKKESTFEWAISDGFQVRNQQLGYVVRQQAELIKNRVLQLEKEKEKFEEEKDNFACEVKKYRDHQEEYRKMIFSFKEQILDLMNPQNVKEYPLLQKLRRKDVIDRYSRTSYSSPRRVDNSEIDELSAKIKDLETQVQDKYNEAKVLTLARYKNQLSNLRSQRAITSSALTSATIKSTMNSFEKTWEKEEVKRNQRIQEEKVKFSRSCNSSPLGSPRTNSQSTVVSMPKIPIKKPPKPVLSQHKCELPIQKKESTFRENREIRSIKARLSDKEDELREKEKFLLSNWSTVPCARKLINAIESEQKRLFEKSKKLDEQLNNIDKMNLEAAEKLAHVRVKETEVNKKAKEVEQQISTIGHQRLYIDNKLSNLIQCLF